MDDFPFDARRTRLATAAYCLAHDTHECLVWERRDGSRRTDFRRRIRGLIIELRLERSVPGECRKMRESTLRVRSPEAGILFEVVIGPHGGAIAVTLDLPGAWEDSLQEALRGSP
jgi:hypothetical protein